MAGKDNINAVTRILHRPAMRIHLSTSKRRLPIPLITANIKDKVNFHFS